MDTKDLVIIVVVAAAIGFSLYRKYMKKDQDKSYGTKQPQSDSTFHTSPKDDDYEPYSGKQGR